MISGMRIAVLAFVALLASCEPTQPVPMGEILPVSSDTPPPPPDPVKFIDAVSKDRASRVASSPVFSALVAAPALVPQGVETLSDGQISFTISGHYGWQKTAGGRFIVHVPEFGTAQVHSVHSSVGPVWSGINVPGINGDLDLNGQSLTFPRWVNPCDAMWIASGAAGGTDRPALGYASANGANIDEAVGICFVPYDCREAVAGKLLCGPIWGARGLIVDFLRANPWPVAWIDWAKLPDDVNLDELYQIPGQWRPGDENRINPNSWGASRPTIADAYAKHRWFPLDLYSGWRTIGRTAYTAHQGYGTFVLGQMSEAMLLACSSAPLEERKPLVLAIIQRGIDDLAGLADGSWRYALGGWCWGRVGPIVMLGHLYGIDIFADPTPVVGNRLPEHQLVTVTTWWGRPNWTGYLYSTSNQNPSDVGLWTRHPSTWGDRHTAGTEAWQVCYAGQVIPAMTGTAVAIILMGREQSAWKLCNAVRCWMTLPPAEIRATLDNLGINLNFRQDYAMPVGLGVHAFDRYVSTSVTTADVPGGQ